MAKPDMEMEEGKGEGFPFGGRKGKRGGKRKKGRKGRKSGRY
jgi:hypothetical protein